ncbi:YfhO family protein, partial [Klebsiella pneumoniae]|nr:YfhO family protein [Klebsiella pneumoniae]
VLGLLHFSPIAASAFNGFSAPQNRFEYLLAFTIGAAVAAGLTEIKNIKRKEIAWSCLLTLLVYIAVIRYEDVDLSLLKNWGILALLFLAIAAFAAVGLRYKKSLFFLNGCILVSTVLIANVYEKYVLSEGSDIKSVSKDYMTSNDYDGEEK